jgi:hypothetical protein
MLANYFSLSDEILISRSAAIRARNEQAYYEKHANAAARAHALKWLLAALIVLFGFAVSADDNVYVGKPNELLKTAATVKRSEGVVSRPASRNIAATTVTTFVDGPTGFVFVYTVEGWKFVRSSKN